MRTEEEIQKGLARLDKKDFTLRKIKSLKAQITRALHENRLATAARLREEKKILETQYEELCKS